MCLQTEVWAQFNRSFHGGVYSVLGHFAVMPFIVIVGYQCFGRVFCLHFQNNPEDQYHNDNILYTPASYFKRYKSLFLKIFKYSVTSVGWSN